MMKKNDAGWIGLWALLVLPLAFAALVVGFGCLWLAVAM